MRRRPLRRGRRLSRPVMRRVRQDQRAVCVFAVCLLRAVRFSEWCCGLHAATMGRSVFGKISSVATPVRPVARCTTHVVVVRRAVHSRFCRSFLGLCSAESHENIRSLPSVLYKVPVRQSTHGTGSAYKVPARHSFRNGVGVLHAIG